MPRWITASIASPSAALSQASNVVGALSGAGRQVFPDALWQPLRESRDRLYLLMPAHDRKLRGDKGAEVEGGSVAASAELRYGHDSKYRPPGLDDWLKADRPVTPLPEAMR